jgi:dihydrofolate reductase
VEEALMTKERKIIVYIATSADGYIARLDGTVEWLNRPRTAGDYGMGAFFKSIDTILWGRKTYDQALGFGKKGGGFGSKIKNFVFTHRPPAKPDPAVEFVNKQVSDFARSLRATPGKGIWMMGGGGLIASFLDAGEIDEFIIHVIPTFIGEGIPLIAPRHRLVPLRLRSTRRYPDGVVRLHYAVERQAKAPAQKAMVKRRRVKRARRSPQP